ncbi:3-methyladenine DNA glycosylase [Gordonia jinghuaiqii]|uniref:3-methyladenine DNA glycosylase n=1 Tax=Gordonia jinghuaiqii TaxID=2758710 RepID=A0A7D7LPA2_9ACTN|nr:3-methyladenine DNA glycosylase [Gordonia jinghuaiqii]MCR5976772.1 3-methyladenine DNA glycosylase [Gordonia jinghuaiqii]QMS99944.1 3-methyladenine DNA glycosylase [Gordonia jinghuaiqii]
MTVDLRTPGAVLSGPQWRARSESHRREVDDLIGPYLAARRRGAKHPVIDFLFTYYSSRPAHVLRWHPGYGVLLDDAEEFLSLTGYERRDSGVTVGHSCLRRRVDALTAAVDLLGATAARPARLGCFGLHEWAMVYRAQDTRHDVPLRLGRSGTDAVVEQMPLRCTHFDAFRFFTDPARPRNETVLDRATQIEHEQPGCLHATMDLYRYCFTLAPLIPSDLTLECFALALRARDLDMRASPYDLRDLGYHPVPIETPAGRAEYVREQARIADDGAVLRERLRENCTDLLHAARHT